MVRPILECVQMTTWAAADMMIVELAPAERDFAGLGLDVHAVIRCGWEEPVPIAFLLAGDRKEIKKFRKLVGTTVPIEMTGWPRRKGRFEPDALRLHRVRALRKSWYTPRVRET